MLSGLNGDSQKRLSKAMQNIQDILDKRVSTLPRSFILRDPEPGDMGWVTYRHGAIYAEEYGWDATFETLVAQIVSDFIKNYNPARERCWIAEMDGEIVGSVFVVQASQDTAKLRLLLLEAKARGLGLGKRLVEDASVLPGAAGTINSLCGRTACWSQRATFIRRPASRSSLRKSTTVLAKTWSARPGN